MKIVFNKQFLSDVSRADSTVEVYKWQIGKITSKHLNQSTLTPSYLFQTSNMREDIEGKETLIGDNNILNEVSGEVGYPLESIYEKDNGILRLSLIISEDDKTTLAESWDSNDKYSLIYIFYHDYRKETSISEQTDEEETYKERQHRLFGEEEKIAFIIVNDYNNNEITPLDPDSFSIGRNFFKIQFPSDVISNIKTTLTSNAKLLEGPGLQGNNYFVLDNDSTTLVSIDSYFKAVLQTKESGDSDDLQYFDTTGRKIYNKFRYREYNGDTFKITKISPTPSINYSVPKTVTLDYFGGDVIFDGTCDYIEYEVINNVKTRIGSGTAKLGEIEKLLMTPLEDDEYPLPIYSFNKSCEGYWTIRVERDDRVNTSNIHEPKAIIAVISISNNYFDPSTGTYTTEELIPINLNRGRLRILQNEDNKWQVRYNEYLNSDVQAFVEPDEDGNDVYVYLYDETKDITKTITVITTEFKNNSDFTVSTNGDSVTKAAFDSRFSVEISSPNTTVDFQGLASKMKSAGEYLGLQGTYWKTSFSTNVEETYYDTGSNWSLSNLYSFLYCNNTLNSLAYDALVYHYNNYKDSTEYAAMGEVLTELYEFFSGDPNRLDNTLFPKYKNLSNLLEELYPTNKSVSDYGNMNAETGTRYFELLKYLYPHVVTINGSETTYYDLALQKAKAVNTVIYNNAGDAYDAYKAESIYGFNGAERKWQSTSSYYTTFSGLGSLFSDMNKYGLNNRIAYIVYETAKYIESLYQNEVVIASESATRPQYVYTISITTKQNNNSSIWLPRYQEANIAVTEDPIKLIITAANSEESSYVGHAYLYCVQRPPLEKLYAFQLYSSYLDSYDHSGSYNSTISGVQISSSSSVLKGLTLPYNSELVGIENLASFRLGMDKSILNDFTAFRWAYSFSSGNYTGEDDDKVNMSTNGVVFEVQNFDGTLTKSALIPATQADGTELNNVIINTPSYGSKSLYTSGYMSVSLTTDSSYIQSHSLINTSASERKIETINFYAQGIPIGEEDPGTISYITTASTSWRSYIYMINTSVDIYQEGAPAKITSYTDRLVFNALGWYSIDVYSNSKISTSLNTPAQIDSTMEGTNYTIVNDEEVYSESHVQRFYFKYVGFTNSWYNTHNSLGEYDAGSITIMTADRSVSIDIPVSIVINSSTLTLGAATAANSIILTDLGNFTYLVPRDEGQIIIKTTQTSNQKLYYSSTDNGYVKTNTPSGSVSGYGYLNHGYEFTFNRTTWDFSGFPLDSNWQRTINVVSADGKSSDDYTFIVLPSIKNIIPDVTFDENNQASIDIILDYEEGSYKEVTFTVCSGVTVSLSADSITNGSLGATILDTSSSDTSKVIKVTATNTNEEEKVLIDSFSILITVASTDIMEGVTLDTDYSYTYNVNVYQDGMGSLVGFSSTTVAWSPFSQVGAGYDIFNNVMLLPEGYTVDIDDGDSSTLVASIIPGDEGHDIISDYGLRIKTTGQPTVSTTIPARLSSSETSNYLTSSSPIYDQTLATDINLGTVRFYFKKSGVLVKTQDITFIHKGLKYAIIVGPENGSRRYYVNQQVKGNDLVAIKNASTGEIKTQTSLVVQYLSIADSQFHSFVGDYNITSSISVYYNGSIFSWNSTAEGAGYVIFSTPEDDYPASYKVYVKYGGSATGQTPIMVSPDKVYVSSGGQSLDTNIITIIQGPDTTSGYDVNTSDDAVYIDIKKHDGYFTLTLAENAIGGYSSSSGTGGDKYLGNISINGFDISEYTNTGGNNPVEVYQKCAYCTLTEQTGSWVGNLYKVNFLFNCTNCNIGNLTLSTTPSPIAADSSTIDGDGTNLSVDSTGSVPVLTALIQASSSAQSGDAISVTWSDIKIEGFTYDDGNANSFGFTFSITVNTTYPGS